MAGGNRDTQVAKRQRLYLKHYYNAPVWAMAWQRDMTLTYDNDFIIFSNFLIQCYIIICVTLCIGHYTLVEIKLQFWCITIKL